MNLVALIPARKGSQRCPGKNTRPFCGVPLWRRAVQVARASGVFPPASGGVMVVTDDEAILNAGDVSDCYIVPRSSASATHDAPDILWVQEALKHVGQAPSTLGKLSPQMSCPAPHALVILRPTSPFRTAETIRRAVRQFSRSECHSLRAVQPVTQTPYKMWRCAGPGYPMLPVLDERNPAGVPWHSTPTQTHPPVYIQNACLEIVWTYIARDHHSLSGTSVIPFFTEGDEGFDLNTEEDWARAEALAASHPELIPA